MKKHLCVFIALAAVITLFASTGPVLAYTVTGDLSAAGSTALTGSQSYTGTLSDLFDTVSHEAIYINNGTPYSDMYANQDYIVATSSSGAKATFSVGEITVGNATINISGNNSTGYTISGNGQTLHNLANINVVHTTMPAGTSQYSPSFTIQGSGVTTTLYNSSNFPVGYTTVTVPASSGNSNTYTGVSLLTLLQQDGVNTGNLNQYVIATGIDGGEAVLSMDEIVHNSTGTSTDIVATKENGSALSSARGYARLVLPTDSSTSRSVFTLYSLTVERVASPVPVPAALLLFGPGLAGLAVLRRRFKL
ncbi:MAG: hypothetical protein ABSB94_16235 [Syntrophorhabdales bacterium]|jgi:hypothetical protein